MNFGPISLALSQNISFICRLFFLSFLFVVFYQHLSIKPCTYTGGGVNLEFFCHHLVVCVGYAWNLMLHSMTHNRDLVICICLNGVICES